jgi:creatinine amidohydrolase/Fe(II)-dependent formamide hydrolase-like protein
MDRVRMFEMTRVDIQKALDRGFSTVIFAVGSNEQHGPHLPTFTDTLLGDAWANRVALKLGKTLQAPTINVGCSDHHMVFPGAISLKPDTLKSLIRDYCVSLAKQGFKNIVILPFHGGNFNAVREATEELSRSLEGIKIVSYTDLAGLFKLFGEFSSRHGVSPAESGTHAGESETSMVLALRKDLVDMKNAETGFLGTIDDKTMALIFSQGITAVSKNGVLGDSRKGEAGKGEEYLELLAEKTADFVRKQLEN